MRQYAKITNIVLILTLLFVGLGIYGVIAHDDGGFFILSQAVNLYLFIFHPAVIFILARLILQYHDHKNLPEAVIFSLLMMPLAPSIFIVFPVMIETIEVGLSTPGALDIVFFIFEVAVMIVGFVVFVRYAKKFVMDRLVPKDLYAMFHYLIAMLIYFYFIRLTIISSLLVTGSV